MCRWGDLPLQAESGTLNMMAGGSMEDFERARPLLDTMSENLFHVGELGVGHKIKLINNAYSMSVAALVAEAVQTARESNVDLKLLYDVMAAGPNRSDFFDWVMAGPLDGVEDKLQFSLSNGCKDVGYFLSMAAAAGVETGIPAAAHARLKQVVDAGHGDAMVPALSRLVANTDD